MEKEIDRRINGWKKFWSLNNIFKNNFEPTQKSEIFNMCVLPALTYGVATWSLTEKLRTKLAVTQNTMLRSMLVVKRTERLRIDNLKKLTPNLRDINTHIRNEK